MKNGAPTIPFRFYSKEEVFCPKCSEKWIFGVLLNFRYTHDIRSGLKNSEQYRRLYISMDRWFRKKETNSRIPKYDCVLYRQSESILHFSKVLDAILSSRGKPVHHSEVPFNVGVSKKCYY